jgi:hypothetical protein
MKTTIGLMKLALKATTFDACLMKREMRCDEEPEEASEQS